MGYDIKRLSRAVFVVTSALCCVAPVSTSSGATPREAVPVVVCPTSLEVGQQRPTLATTSRVWVPVGWTGRVSLYRDALGRQVGQLAPKGLRCQAIDFADGRSIIQVTGTRTLGGMHGFSSALIGRCLSCLVNDLWPFLNASQHARYAAYRPMMLPGVGKSRVHIIHRSADSRAGTVTYQQVTEAMMGPSPSVTINYSLNDATAEQETCSVATRSASLCAALLRHWNEWYPFTGH